MVCGGIILILFGKFYLNIILNFIFKLLKKDYLFIVTSLFDKFKYNLLYI